MNEHTDSELNQLAKEQDEFWEQQAAAEKAEAEANNALLASISCPPEEFILLLDGATLTGPLSVVEKPEGEDQHLEFSPDSFFKREYVDQWKSGGEACDDCYSGFIYAEFGENKWLKIPYSC